MIRARTHLPPIRRYHARPLSTPTDSLPLPAGRFPIWCLAALLACAGCDESGRPPAMRSVKEAGETISGFAELPGLRATHNEALRAELARLESENATPLALADRQRRTDLIAPRLNYDGARAIGQIFPERMRRSLLADLKRVYPAGAFEFDRWRLRQAAEVRSRYEQQQAAASKLFSRGDLAFEWDATKGICDELPFVELVSAGLQLDALAIAGLLEHGRLQEAIQSLDNHFRAASAMADVPYVVPRIAAVHQRREALEIVRAVCQHPNADVDIYQQLHNLIVVQQAALPPDASAWIGDRAAGLHLYELVRDGYLLSLLTYDELLQFRDRGGVDELGVLIAKNLDNDQLFYLRKMREAISECQKPFYKRQAWFAALESELAALRDSASYPFVADFFLLGQLVEGQRWQAVDRARLEAWRLAFRAALDGAAPEVTNPLTGYPFVIDLQTERVVVDGIDTQDQEPTVELPIPWKADS